MSRNSTSVISADRRPVNTFLTWRLWFLLVSAREKRLTLVRMEWFIVFLVIAALTAILLLSQTDQIPARTAVQHLRNGALLIDVRMPPEYAASHLPNAVNIPVTGIRSLVSMRIKDKNRVLLLHGLVGMRSTLAKTMLVALGYSNAYNLGSYERASQIAIIR